MGRHYWKERNSNTSHVIVYQLSGITVIEEALIQIHLMLLFIRAAISDILSIIIFKYISCYCLSLPELLSAYRFHHSNTSHVIVYRSCFFCSIFLLSNSNTSHVIVYLKQDLQMLTSANEFKYISCYCLSLVLKLNI